MISKEDRYLGCLIGLAVGDAVGTTLEFKPPGTFAPISDMMGGGPFRLKAGEWTDDTSMALCLAASLVETKQFDPLDQLERYRRWCDEGYMSSNGKCFDIGNTVSHALDIFCAYGNADAGPTSPNMAGNGSIMRLAPVPMFFADDAQAAIEFSAKSSSTTHGATACVDACRYFGGLIWAALNGHSKEEILSAGFNPSPARWQSQPLCPEIAEVASGSFKHTNPPAIRGTGYVVRSLEAALWAFYYSHDFKTGCLLAVNLGDDADTTGAVYGQLAGAFYGFEAIPAPWRSQLAKRELISELAIKLMPSPT